MGEGTTEPREVGKNQFGILWHGGRSNYYRLEAEVALLSSDTAAAPMLWHPALQSLHPASVSYSVRCMPFLCQTQMAEVRSGFLPLQDPKPDADLKAEGQRWSVQCAVRRTQYGVSSLCVDSAVSALLANLASPGPLSSHIRTEDATLCANPPCLTMCLQNRCPALNSKCMELLHLENVDELGNAQSRRAISGHPQTKRLDPG